MYYKNLHNKNVFGINSKFNFLYRGLFCFSLSWKWKINQCINKFIYERERESLMRRVARHPAEWKTKLVKGWRKLFFSTAIWYIISDSIGFLIHCQVIQLREGQLWYNTCSWSDYWLFCFNLSLYNNYEDLESGICVVQELATIISWCTNVS